MYCAMWPSSSVNTGKMSTNRQRNHVERTVNRLNGWRRLATRYEKREVNYLAMITIAAIVLLWLE
jgi:transposase